MNEHVASLRGALIELSAPAAAMAKFEDPLNIHPPLAAEQQQQQAASATTAEAKVEFLTG